MERISYDISIRLKFSVLGTQNHIRLRNTYLAGAGKIALTFHQLLLLLPSLRLTKFDITSYHRTDDGAYINMKNQTIDGSNF